MTNMETKSMTQSFAEEAFVVDVQSFLHQLMTEKSFSRSQLADALGVTRARISQIFSDDCKNLTVRLLARVVHALGEQPEITSALCRRLEESEMESRRAEAIASAANVCALWRDTSSTDDEDAVARTYASVSPDPRISTILGNWRRRPSAALQVAA